MNTAHFSVVHIDPSDAGHQSLVAGDLTAGGVSKCLDDMMTDEQRVMHILDSQGRDVTHHERWRTCAN